MAFDYSRQIPEKSTDIKFCENPFSGSRVAPCGRTYRHDEDNTIRSFAKSA